MSEKNERTQYQGIYQRRSESRRNARDGKPDACFYYTIKIDGQKKWVKVGWKSEGYTVQDARTIRGDHMQALRHGKEFLKNKDEETQANSQKTMTFGESWQIYRDKWLPNLSHNQYDIWRYDKHIAPHFADIPLHEIKTLDLEDFKQKLIKSGLSPASVKHVLGLMRRVFNKLVEWELYDGRIPTTGVKMPKVDNARVRFLTQDEADLLLEDIKNRSLTWWRISSLSLNTGMRLNEILSLTWGDIDIKHGLIQVLFGKTGRRMVQMNVLIKDLFLDLPHGSMPPFALVFPSKKDEESKSTAASRTFSRAVQRLGLNPKGIHESQKVVFHTLRHTFASWLAIDGVPLYTISTLLGHASIEMTKRYAHLCPDIKQDAVEKIAQLQRGRSSMADSPAA
jgi:integrase